MYELTKIRIANEAKYIEKNKFTFAQIIQDESNLFVFYFLLKSIDEPYKGGYFIGKIILPEKYPSIPPELMLLTPNGRFKTNNNLLFWGGNNIYWAPTWRIDSIIMCFNSMFLNNLECNTDIVSDNERKLLAKNSIKFNIDNYRDIFIRFDQFVNNNILFSAQNESDITKDNKELINVGIKRRRSK